MKYLARILGPEGETWIAEIMLPSKMPHLDFSYLSPKTMRRIFNNEDDPESELTVTYYRARLERELPPEDGGPLLIYRVSAKDAIG